LLTSSRPGLVHVIQDYIVIDVVDPGGLFGMSSLLAETPHLSTAVAIEDTQAIEIDRNDLKILLTKKPMAGLNMMTMVESTCAPPTRSCARW